VALMDVVDEVLDIVEHAIRQRFKLAAAEFDLAFTDTERKIAWALDTETERIKITAAPTPTRVTPLLLLVLPSSTAPILRRSGARYAVADRWVPRSTS
jgi:hypothetical protein